MIARILWTEIIRICADGLSKLLLQSDSFGLTTVSGFAVQMFCNRIVLNEKKLGSIILENDEHTYTIIFLCSRSWLEGELEVVTVKKQAKQSLEVLIDSRKSISEEINKTKVIILFYGVQ